MIGLCISASAIADGIGHLISTEQGLHPTGEPCRSYYSLYPPGVVCIKDVKYYFYYDITYEFKGKEYKQKFAYHPGKEIPVDDNGKALPPKEIPMEYEKIVSERRFC